MTLQPLPSEFPYIWWKFNFLFYQFFHWLPWDAPWPGREPWRWPWPAARCRRPAAAPPDQGDARHSAPALSLHNKQTAHQGRLHRILSLYRRLIRIAQFLPSVAGRYCTGDCGEHWKSLLPSFPPTLIPKLVCKKSGFFQYWTVSMLFDPLSSKKSSTTPYKSRKIKSLKLSEKSIKRPRNFALVSKFHYSCVKKCLKIFSPKKLFLLKSLKSSNKIETIQYFKKMFSYKLRLMI